MWFKLQNGSCNRYEATHGFVKIDGEDVRSLDHAWLHNVVRLVGQEPVLFSGTIEDNILFVVV